MGTTAGIFLTPEAEDMPLALSEGRTTKVNLAGRSRLRYSPAQPRALQVVAGELESCQRAGGNQAR